MILPSTNGVKGRQQSRDTVRGRRWLTGFKHSLLVFATALPLWYSKPVYTAVSATHAMAEPSIRRVADLIRSAGSVVVLTGAGVSTPSGIPDFRSPFSGLWNTFDPMEVASIWGFHDNPERFYRWFMPVARAIRTARPNAAHHALAALERAGKLDLLITQNIDGLHQQAGSSAVVELHGDIRSARCLGCAKETPSDLLWARVERGEVLRCEIVRRSAQAQCHSVRRAAALRKPAAGAGSRAALRPDAGHRHLAGGRTGQRPATPGTAARQPHRDHQPPADRRRLAGRCHRSAATSPACCRNSSRRCDSSADQKIR